MLYKQRKPSMMLLGDGYCADRMDGDSRWCSLSMRHVTGMPIKFVGMGEKQDALEEFVPDRLAGRILDMGDVVALVEKAAAAMKKKKQCAWQSAWRLANSI